ncbi:Dbl homology domain-containing protein [Panus rudis PR-1116 ss-1]|nr:Dbl homology domain-containing protein [Panus rudis PR-1116 ss-1]
MKAFLNRFNRGLSKEKDREKEVTREKVPQLPPLGQWPPRDASTPSSFVSAFKPLPDISVRPLPPIDEPHPSDSPASSSTPTPTVDPAPLPPPISKDDPPAAQPAPEAPQVAPSRSARSEQDSAGRSSRKANNGSNGTDVHKKVAFISPPPTPTPQSDRPLPSSDTPPPGTGPAKTNVSRFQGKDSRGSTSTAASSRTDLTSTAKAAKPASTRAATSPLPKHFHDNASIHQSLRSTTPYSQMTNASSRILAAQSWSEGAEEDLVSNLGQRERTRQEVLWEIVASEERYVNELIKLKETFIEPLLHPYSSSPISSPVAMEYEDFSRMESPRESIDYLPIAARFLSPTGSRTDGPSGQVPRKDDPHKDTPNIDGESLNSDEEDEAEDQLGNGYSAFRPKFASGLSQAAKHNHPRSPYGTTRTASGGKPNVPFPSRSHQSLPPPPRPNPLTGSTQSLSRQSFIESNGQHQSGHKSVATAASSSKVLRKFKKSNPTSPSVPVAIPGAVPPTQLPEDLRKCLEAIEDGILQGHIKLSDGLRKRYEEQYPLVRSLADVFVSNSHILHGYATYVLHLERALEQVDNALSTASATKKPKKQDADQWLKVCQYLQKLEVMSSEKGETGLAISLSKPFQRLLKYPLLFQNLLFHTDPSTFEYESTLQMVAEVETIVRSIEDEKIQKEERDKTRDVFARIEGLDKVKQLMVPKPSRVLVEERPVSGINPLTDPKASSPPATSSTKGVRGKTSFKRLSDVLQSGSHGVGGKKDLWLVAFNDVVLRCQRTGTTSLPLVAATNARTNSLPELQGKAKYATTGRRNSHTKPRNLYKFIKIETWDIGEVVQPREGVVSMDDVARTRQQVHSGVPKPRIVPMPEDDEDGAESDDSDRKSKMSFSYWGADKVTLQKPVVKGRQVSNSSTRRGVPVTTTTAYARESSANAKFGTRLVSADSPTHGRPASRRTQATPVNGTKKPSLQSDEGHSIKVTVTRERPAWDGSTRANATSTPVPKRPRNLSQNSAAARTAATKLSSPAPSEDSGVGFYRNLVAQDPSLVKLNETAR